MKEPEEATENGCHGRPQGFRGDLGLAHLALRLLEGVAGENDFAGTGMGSLREQDFTRALRTAKSLTLLASKVEEEVEIYQLFERDVFMSPAEIAGHLKGCQWPSLDTPYFVEQSVMEILGMIHEEIQCERRRLSLAARQVSGSIVDVTEAEGSIHRALHGLLVGTSIGDLLGGDAEEALRLGIDSVMARVRDLLNVEAASGRQEPGGAYEFFNKLCDGATYENYLGRHGDSSTVSFDSLPAILESLASRFEGRFAKEQVDVLQQLRDIDSWLGSQEFLALGEASPLEKTIGVLEGLEAKGSEGEGGGTDQGGGSRVTGEFTKELNALADRWAVRGIADRIKVEAKGCLVEALERLVKSYNELESWEAPDEDEQVRYREFPHCADAILKWFNGVRVRPRTFVHHIRINYRADTGGRELVSLDTLLLRRIAEFHACLQELDLCLDGSFLPDAERGDLQVGIKGVENLLHSQRQTLPSPSGPLREAARSRATELLDSVCAREFKPGNINARLLFEYTARRGIKKLGKKRDQALVARLSELKPGCVVAPATIFPHAESPKQ